MMTYASAAPWLTSGDTARLAAQEPRSAFAAKPPAGGPRLYYTADRARALALNADGDPRVRQTWRSFVSATERLLTEPLISEAEALGGAGQHGRIFAASRHCSSAGFALGLAFHATGAPRFFERLREILLHYATYREWVGPGFATRRPRWNSELATAAFVFGYATGYDAIADRLAPEERRVIRGALLDRGARPLLEDWVLPGRRIHTLDSMGHNWWAVCVGMAGVGLLALIDEEPQAETWLDHVRRALAEWVTYPGNPRQNKPANFDPAGGLYEGVHYTEYGVAEYLRFRLAHQSVYGAPPFDDRRWLESTVTFALHTLYPATGGAMSVNFDDSDGRTSFVAETLRLIRASGMCTAEVDWYLGQIETSETPVGAAPKDTFRVLHPAAPPDRLPARTPTALAFTGIGWAVLRSSWGPDATLLAVKSGFTWNHAHADAGSFILFHRGQPLLIDSGKCGYDRPEYMDYYVRSRAHNVVLFDGEGQSAEDNLRGVKTPGSVQNVLQGAQIRYVSADATGPMAHVYSRNYRHWLWIGRVIVVIDDIRAHRAGRLDWLLHYAGTKEATADGVRVTNAGATARIRFLNPQPLDLVTERGLADHRPEVAREFLRFSTTATEREMKFVTAIVLEEPDQPEPEVEILRGSDSLGVRVSQDGQVTDVWLNLMADGRLAHLNSINRCGAWTTDAYLLAATRRAGSPETAVELESLLIADGSFVREDDASVWERFAKANVLLGRGGEAPPGDAKQ